MVKIFTHKHLFDHDWESVTQAIWLKYPNPYSRHVHSQDILSRSIDPCTGILHTKRLIVKSGSVPQWLAMLFGKKAVNRAEALVMEDSQVDINTRQMQTVTRNLNHRKWMVVEETVKYAAINAAQTEILTQATFRCSLR
jgi:4-amino-4-deoxychorismate lyase